jgi:hypothetical protein
MMVRETFDWLKPAPLWENGLQSARQADFFQPQLIQLTDDNFMATFRAAAGSNDPSQLKALVVPLPPPANPPVKLFQAAHGCHYLVSAELCCRVPGFPDRTVQRSDGESVFFVLRRFLNDVEYGWVVNGTKKCWKSLNGQPRTVLPNEERLPLFAIAGSGQRTMFVGYVPVATSDAYSMTVPEYNNKFSAAEQAALAAQNTTFPIDVRIEELGALFITPLTKFPDQIQLNRSLISVYMLLDLVDFFVLYLPNVAAALTSPTTVSGATLSAAEQQLLAFLKEQTVGGSGPALDAALRAVAAQRTALVTPDGDVDPTTLGFGGYDLTAGSIDTTGLTSAVQNALSADDPKRMLTVPRQNITGETYALRCVYERPQCSPPLQVVSQPSQPLQLAAFFDADAPARPIRIVMPTDVSLAGIRKFNQGVTFIISDSLQQKINMLTGHERDILQSPTVGGPGSGGIAWMCSFSIQIIFIVAFFLLLMFVIILNICFWWIAFFKICIPYPKSLLSN